MIFQKVTCYSALYYNEKARKEVRNNCSYWRVRNEEGKVINTFLTKKNAKRWLKRERKRQRMWKMIKDLVENPKHIDAVFSAALEKYPEAEKGLIFFLYASGLKLCTPTEEDMQYAAEVIKREGLEYSDPKPGIDKR